MGWKCLTRLEKHSIRGPLTIHDNLSSKNQKQIPPLPIILLKVEGKNSTSLVHCNVPRKNAITGWGLISQAERDWVSEALKSGLFLCTSECLQERLSWKYDKYLEQHKCFGAFLSTISAFHQCCLIKNFSFGSHFFPAFHPLFDLLACLNSKLVFLLLFFL